MSKTGLPRFGLDGNREVNLTHQKRVKYFADKLLRLRVLSALSLIVFSVGCIKVKQERETARLLKTETAPQAELMNEINRFARVNSMRAKMDLKFEDTSFAELGLKDSYRDADGEVVVQRPGMILLKVQAPFIKTDIAQMTSDGETFRVAILVDADAGKYKKFLKGTNNSDYSKLQKSLSTANIVKGKDAKEAKENVNALANLRPQHFTDAMLVRPTVETAVYTQSSIFEIEQDSTVERKSPVRTVMRGYYLLDEFFRQADGSLKIERRFWFDRVGGIRLARQQIFDSTGEIESDIVYGKQGNLTETGNYTNLPLEIKVTRPKEKYSMRLTYQTPEAVTIGTTFPAAAFVLQNSWNLEEVDLDKQLTEANARQPTSNINKTAITRFQ